MSVNQVSAFDSFNFKYPKNFATSQAVEGEKNLSNASVNNSQLKEQTQMDLNQNKAQKIPEKDYGNVIWYTMTAILSAIGFIFLGKGGYLGTKIQNFFCKAIAKNSNAPESFGRIKDILGKNYKQTLDGLKKSGLDFQTSVLNGQNILAYENKSGNKIILSYKNDNQQVLNGISVIHKSGSRTDIDILSGNSISIASHYKNGVATNRLYDAGKFKSLEMFSIEDLTKPFYGKEYINGGYREYVCPTGEIRYAHKSVNGKNKFWTFIPEDLSNKRLISAEDYKNALFDLFYNSDRQIKIKLKE